MSETIIERLKSFYDFEIKLSEDELQYWDIFRREIFVIYCYKYDVTRLYTKGSFIKKSRLLFRSFMNFFRLGELKDKKLIYTFSRYNKNGQFYDPNVYDIYKTDISSFRIIEMSNFDSKLLYKTYSDYFFSSLEHLVRVPKNKIILGICKKINEAFKLNLTYEFYVHIYRRFKFESFYYSKLYKYLRTKAVFFVNNDNHKGRIFAAKKLNIPVVEIQHGDIGYESCPYFYKKDMNVKNFINADVLLVNSEFWKKRVCFNGDVINVGNSFYYSKNTTELENEYDLVIFTNKFQLTNCNDLLRKILEQRYTGKICYKLHPDQFSDYEKVKQIFSLNKNVDVVFREKDSIQLIRSTNNILVIHSTVAYQAVDYGVKTFIYKENSSEWLLLDDLAKYENVMFISSVNELLKNLCKSRISNRLPVIYEDFNNEKYREFTNKYL